MLNAALINIAALVPMKDAHSHLMLALIGFANRDGEACPSLRTLAQVAHKKLSTVQRAMSEMEALEYIRRRRRPGTSTIYRIAERLLARPQKPESRQRNTPSPTSGTEERSLETSPRVSDSVPVAEEKGVKVLNAHEGVSSRSARSEVDPTEAKAKRQNQIKTLTRWARHAPQMAEDDRVPTLAMLARASLAVDEWDNRPDEDKRWYDALDARSRRHPLDPVIIHSLRQIERRGGPAPAPRPMDLSAIVKTSLPQMPLDHWEARRSA